jgi:NAD(P)H-flavin reductase
MNKIVRKEQFSEKVFLFEVEAPMIAKSRRAGHFVIIRVDEKGERIPLTIADSNLEKGTITLVVQTVGLTSTKLCRLNPGDYILDVVGPLGQATHIEKFGTVLCAGGGVGVAPMLPIIKALKQAGNRVISVLAGRSKELIILEEQVREYSDEVVIMTDDGSYGNKGVVTVGMENVIQSEKVDKCFAIGPAIMMKFCCLLTKKYSIPTDVSLNTIMVDGTGMCGACRITVGGKMKFVCVDGPEFDGHEVDFDEMFKRIRSRFGGMNIPKHSTARELVRLYRMKKHFAVGLISDQSPNKSEAHYWTTFLNQDTVFMDGAERLAKMMNIPVFYCELTRKSRGYCQASFELITETPKQTADGEITEAFARKLENTIRRDPPYWFWSHRRWKLTREVVRNHQRQEANG